MLLPTHETPPQIHILEKKLKKLKDKNKNEDRLNIAVTTSFFVGERGLLYQASVYPTGGGEPAWLAILFGQVGSAPEIPEVSVVPVDYRLQVAGAVRRSAQWEFEKLVSAVVDSQVQGTIQ